jgi:hypothetical protein
MVTKLSPEQISEMIAEAKAKHGPKLAVVSSGPAAVPVTEREWPTMSEKAYHGLAGDVVRAIDPHSEADPVALLIQFLVCAGNVIGNCPYYQVESDHHHANLFVTLVGNTAKGRKGTSMGRIGAIIKLAEAQWHGDRTKGGLSSGEGLIHQVRDEVTRWKDGDWEVIDPGIADKRLMVIEPEFASALAATERHGNTLSPIVRNAWDGRSLETLTRNSQLKATGAHISIIAHITTEELRARLTRTEMANGYANRFLYLLVRRSKELPFGGDQLSYEVIADLGARLNAAVETAKMLGRVGWTGDAAKKWRSVYSALSAPQPGLLGAVTARGEAQVVRLALLYALLDGASLIAPEHLEAALAVGEYCEASAAFIFGASLGDPVADEILRALQQAGAAGMTRTAIRDLFGRNQSSDRIGAALVLLLGKERAKAEVRDTGGRPSEIWFATTRERNG